MFDTTIMSTLNDIPPPTGDSVPDASIDPTSSSTIITEPTHPILTKIQTTIIDDHAPSAAASGDSTPVSTISKRQRKRQASQRNKHNRMIQGEGGQKVEDEDLKVKQGDKVDEVTKKVEVLNTDPGTVVAVEATTTALVEKPINKDTSATESGTIASIETKPSTPIIVQPTIPETLSQTITIPIEEQNPSDAPIETGNITQDTPLVANNTIDVDTRSIPNEIPPVVGAGTPISEPLDQTSSVTPVTNPVQQPTTTTETIATKTPSQPTPALASNRQDRSRTTSIRSHQVFSTGTVDNKRGRTKSARGKGDGNVDGEGSEEVGDGKGSEGNVGDESSVKGIDAEKPKVLEVEDDTKKVQPSDKDSKAPEEDPKTRIDTPPKDTISKASTHTTKKKRTRLTSNSPSDVRSRTSSKSIDTVSKLSFGKGDSSTASVSNKSKNEKEKESIDTMKNDTIHSPTTVVPRTSTNTTAGSQGSQGSGNATISKFTRRKSNEDDTASITSKRKTDTGKKNRRALSGSTFPLPVAAKKENGKSSVPALTEKVVVEQGEESKKVEEEVRGDGQGNGKDEGKGTLGSPFDKDKENDVAKEGSTSNDIRASDVPTPLVETPMKTMADGSSLLAEPTADIESPANSSIYSPNAFSPPPASPPLETGPKASSTQQNRLSPFTPAFFPQYGGKKSTGSGRQEFRTQSSDRHTLSWSNTTPRENNKGYSSGTGPRNRLIEQTPDAVMDSGGSTASHVRLDTPAAIMGMSPITEQRGKKQEDYARMGVGMRDGRKVVRVISPVNQVRPHNAYSNAFQNNGSGFAQRSVQSPFVPPTFVSPDTPQSLRRKSGVSSTPRYKGPRRLTYEERVRPVLSRVASVAEKDESKPATIDEADSSMTDTRAEPESVTTASDIENLSDPDSDEEQDGNNEVIQNTLINVDPTSRQAAEQGLAKTLTTHDSTLDKQGPRLLTGISPAMREGKFPGRILNFGLGSQGRSTGGFQAVVTKMNEDEYEALKREARSEKSLDLPTPKPVMAKVVETQTMRCDTCSSLRSVENLTTVKPCNHVACFECLNALLNVVCSIGVKGAPGRSTCSACHTEVDSVEPKLLASICGMPIAENQAAATSPEPHLEATEAKDETELAPSAKADLLPAHVGTEGLEQGATGLTTVMRIDNIAWDVTPKMVEDFLPKNTLAENHIQPTHILLDRNDGKAKDYLFIEVRSKEAAQKILQQRQNAILGSGGRARPVTITFSTHHALVDELRPATPAELMNLLQLCRASLENTNNVPVLSAIPALNLPPTIVPPATPSAKGSALNVVEGGGMPPTTPGGSSAGRYIKSRYAPFWEALSVMSKMKKGGSVVYWDMFYVAAGIISALAKSILARPNDSIMLAQMSLTQQASQILRPTTPPRTPYAAAETPRKITGVLSPDQGGSPTAGDSKDKDSHETVDKKVAARPEDEQLANKIREKIKTDLEKKQKLDQSRERTRTRTGSMNGVTFPMGFGTGKNLGNGGGSTGGLPASPMATPTRSRQESRRLERVRQQTERAKDWKAEDEEMFHRFVNVFESVFGVSVATA